MKDYLVFNLIHERSCDWDPLLNSLRVCKNMVNITFKSYYQPSDDEPGLLSYTPIPSNL